MYIKQLFIVLFSCSLLACAGTPRGNFDEGDERDSPRTDCIFKSSIRGYEVLNDANLVVTAGASRKYHLALQRRANGLRSSWAIGFESSTGSVCAGFDEVVFEGDFRKESIRIASIRRLNDQEYEDILYQFGKKTPEQETTPPPADVNGAEVEELDPAATDNESRG